MRKSVLALIALTWWSFMGLSSAAPANTTCAPSIEIPARRQPLPQHPSMLLSPPKSAELPLSRMGEEAIAVSSVKKQSEHVVVPPSPKSPISLTLPSNQPQHNHQQSHPASLVITAEAFNPSELMQELQPHHPHQQQQLPNPASLYRFKVERKLGKAQTGYVYLVSEPNQNPTQKLHVLKQFLLEKPLAHSDDFNELVLRTPSGRWPEAARILETMIHEIKISELLGDHPNIVKVWSVPLKSIWPVRSTYMLMEFCKEGDLFDFVERPGLTRQRRWLLFTQIALGVAHMHDRQVAHMDLKLENVFMFDENTAKIGDFGSAKSFLNSEREGFLSLSAFSGTIEYSPPEVYQMMILAHDHHHPQHHNRFLNNHRHTTPTGFNPYKYDVWSLGIVYFHLIFGDVPQKVIPSALKLPRLDQTSFYERGYDLFFRKFLSTRMHDFEVDLMMGMLNPDPKLRFSIQDVITDPNFSRRLE